MINPSQTRLATSIAVISGILWGLYWLPVRTLDAAGLGGAWGTLAITLTAATALAPFAWWDWRPVDRLAMASVALGGVCFATYSIAFLYGDVAIITLLWFLTPVWSTLIARYALGWATPRLRLLAIAVGLVGLALILGAGGGPPVPRGLGEWFGLAGGVMWSVCTTGIRLRPEMPRVQAAFIFACGAVICAAALAPMLADGPDLRGIGFPAFGLALVTGVLWWGASVVALMWATARLEPARVGILLMGEVLVGAATAAWLAGEHLGPLELVGGALILLAGVLETWPLRARA